MPRAPRLAAAGRRYAGDTGGNFATLSALIAPFAIILGAFAVDEGSLFLERRESQGMTDLAAISAAMNMDMAEKAALATITDNGLAGASLADGTSKNGPGIDISGQAPMLQVEKGRYVADPGLGYDSRFTAGAEPPNAVRVTLSKTGRTYFAGALLADPKIITRAVAASRAQAAFSVGSRLARLDGGILNALLGKLTGSSISLSVMDYEALVDADVEMFSFLSALATELDIKAGTYDELLRSEANVGRIASALARTEGLGGDAKAAMLKLATASKYATLTVPLSYLVNLGDAGRLAVGDRPAGLNVMANAFQLLTAGAMLANGTNQAKLDLGASIPGLASVSIDLAIGEPPQQGWFAIGERGETVRTAQTRLTVVADIGGPGGIVGTSIRLPLYLELAYAEAKISAISCTPGSQKSAKVSVQARPGIADLYVGEIDASQMRRFTTRPTVSAARIVQAPAVQVTGSAHAEIGSTSAKTLTFSAADIADGVLKRTGTSTYSQSLTASLLGELQLKVSVLGLGVGLPSTVTKSVATTLSAAAPAVDGLLFNMLSLLGVSLGEADVRVNGVSCGSATLVQ